MRELRNVLERALASAPASWRRNIFKCSGADLVVCAGTGGKRPHLVDSEWTRIQEAMTRFDGDTRKAADALGISRATLYRRLAESKKT